MEDSEILALLNKRDENGAAALLEKYGGLCRSLISRILSDERDVEEALNSVVMRLWSSIPPASPENLTAYVAKAARNEALMVCRSNSAKRNSAACVPISEIENVLPSSAGIEERAEANELTRRISEYLNGQPREKRIAFVKRYWFFEPIKQISRETGMTESRITSMLFRMRNELKTRLEQEELI
ncbi:MAG: sigma-70 family RNA polymerase sigma factor [Clostridia bacterium]|nr:sigma-70 family RNA polymerase sigma factor [Clostridia bacterium]